MPTYVYECPKCHKQLELVQSIRDRKHPVCVEEGCNAVEMDSIIQAGSFVLKGSGWARDGYSGGGR